MKLLTTDVNILMISCVNNIPVERNQHENERHFLGVRCGEEAVCGSRHKYYKCSGYTYHEKLQGYFVDLHNGTDVAAVAFPHATETRLATEIPHFDGDLGRNEDLIKS